MFKGLNTTVIVVEVCSHSWLLHLDMMMVVKAAVSRTRLLHVLVSMLVVEHCPSWKSAYTVDICMFVFVEYSGGPGSAFSSLVRTEAKVSLTVLLHYKFVSLTVSKLGFFYSHIKMVYVTNLTWQNSLLFLCSFWNGQYKYSS